MKHYIKRYIWDPLCSVTLYFLASYVSHTGPASWIYLFFLYLLLRYCYERVLALLSLRLRTRLSYGVNKIRKDIWTLSTPARSVKDTGLGPRRPIGYSIYKSNLDPTIRMWSGQSAD